LVPLVVRRLRRLRRLRLLTTGQDDCRYTGQDDCRRPAMEAKVSKKLWSLEDMVAVVDAYETEKSN
jgi:hypothetical protein